MPTPTSIKLDLASLLAEFDIVRKRTENDESAAILILALYLERTHNEDAVRRGIENAHDRLLAETELRMEGSAITDIVTMTDVEAYERLVAMRQDDGKTWDLSMHDKSAIAWALSQIDGHVSAIAKAEKSGREECAERACGIVSGVLLNALSGADKRYQHEIGKHRHGPNVVRWDAVEKDMHAAICAAE